MKRIFPVILAAVCLAGSSNALNVYAAEQSEIIEDDELIENDTFESDFAEEGYEITLTETQFLAQDVVGTYTTNGVNAGSGLNIRKEAKAGSTILGSIPANAKFKVNAISGDWAAVDYNNIKGYVSKAFIKKVENEPGTYTTKDLEAGYNLNIRKEANSTSAILGSIPQNAKFKVTSFTGNWAAVEYNNIKGYVSKDFIKETTGEPTTTTTTQTTTTTDTSGTYTTKDLEAGYNLNIRKEANTTSAILGSIPQNAKFKVTSFTGNWAAVEYNNIKGYVSKDFIQKTTGEPTTTTTTQTTTTTDEPGTYTTKDLEAGYNLNIRKEANTTSAILGSIPQNAKFKVTSFTGNWAAVEYNNIKGYVSKDFIQKTTGEPTTTTTTQTTTTTDTPGTYTTKDLEAGYNLNIRKEANTTSAILGSIPQNAKFKVTSFTGNWAAVEYNNIKGYVSKDFIQKTTGEPTTTTTQTTTTTDTPGTYTTKDLEAGYNLNIRKEANATSAILGSIPQNAKFKVTSFTGNWAAVEYNNIKGYVSKDFIQKTTGEPTTTTTTQTTTTTDETGTYTTKGVDADSNLNIRKEANTSSAILGVIPPNAKFKVTSFSGNWAAVEYNNIKGYVSKDFIQKTTGEPTTQTPTDETGTYTTKGVDADSNLNIRKEANTSSAILGVIPPNAKFKVTSFSGNWAAVEYNNIKGYVSKDFIQKTTGEPTTQTPTDETGTYTTKGVDADSNLNIRKEANASSAILGVIPPNAKFKVTSFSGNWAAVEYNNIKGYVSKDFIQKTTGEPTTQTPTYEYGTYTTKDVDADSSLNIRKEPNANSNVLGEIPANAKFKVTAFTGAWAEVEYNNIKGYVTKSFIQKVDEYNTETVVPKAIPEQSGTYTTQGVKDGLNIRKGNNINSAIKGSIPAGAQFTLTRMLGDWAYVEYKGICGYVSTDYIKKVSDNVVISGDINSDKQNTVADVLLLQKYLLRKGTLSSAQASFADLNKDGCVDGFDMILLRKKLVDQPPVQFASVKLNVINFNQNPSYPTGCESAALYILLKYYNVNVSMDQIVAKLPKGPLPYQSGNKLLGGNPEREFVGDPKNSYSYGVFNGPLAITAANFKANVKTKKGATLSDIYTLVSNGSPVIAWYTTNPERDIYYNDSWYDYVTGELVRWPAGEHAVVICGYDSNNITYSDPYTGTTKTVSKATFQRVFNQLGSRILYY